MVSATTATCCTRQRGAGQKKSQKTAGRRGIDSAMALVLACLLVLCLGRGLSAQVTQSSGSASGSGPGSTSPTKSSPSLQLFELKIDPKTPVQDLLPAAPKSLAPFEPGLVDDLSEVPELCFQEPLDKTLSLAKGMEKLAHVAARIRELNHKEQDGFIKALMAHRSDLQGLPFLLGSDCTMSDERKVHFKPCVDLVRNALGSKELLIPGANLHPTPTSTDRAWINLNYGFVIQKLYTPKSKDEAKLEVPTRVEVLTQVMGAESSAMRLGLVEYLATTVHVQATQALARLALFSAEPEVRQAAIEALKLRREKDYADILLQGLNYPWPQVAKRAGAALTALECNSVLNKLVASLEQPDPRLPQVKKVGTKDVLVAQQLVRLNHNHNCLLCHAPVGPDKMPPSVVTAAVPLPSRPLAPSGYYNSIPESSVRIDVTYLRQDFSLLQPVQDAKPWPDAQRFDFFVRKVELNKKQAQALEAELKQRTASAGSAYHQAILGALRSLTGLDAGTSAPEWRKALKLAG